MPPPPDVCARYSTYFTHFRCTIPTVDHSRVKLKDVTDAGCVGAEYINANYIRQPVDGTDPCADMLLLNTSSENLSLGQSGASAAGSTTSLAAPCASCAAIAAQKACANCQQLQKTCVQCAMKSATLPLGGSIGCLSCASKKSNAAAAATAAASTPAGHKRSESITSRAFSQSLNRSGGGGGGTALATKDMYGGESFKTYIATQGCLPATVSDFWNMIWQENTRVIVMTTKELERGKSKCAKYWPDQGTERVWGPAKVWCLSEHSTADYTLREMMFSWRGREERRIYQYHFQVWPDHGVPADPGCVLNFLHDVNARQEQLMLEGTNVVSLDLIRCRLK